MIIRGSEGEHDYGPVALNAHGGMVPLENRQPLVLRTYAKPTARQPEQFEPPRRGPKKKEFDKRGHLVYRDPTGKAIKCKVCQSIHKNAYLNRIKNRSHFTSKDTIQYATREQG